MKKAIFCLMFLASFIGVAQNLQLDVSVPSEVSTSENFQIVFSFNGNRATQFQPPSFEGVKVLSGPNISRQSFSSTVNGKTERQETTSLTYILRAEREGTLTIGSASISFEGEKYASKPQTIKSVKGAVSHQAQQTGAKTQQAAPSSEITKEDIFLKAVPSSTQLFSGEQLMITYLLYTRIPVADYRVEKLPSNQGFWIEKTPEKTHSPQAREESINGKKYHVYELYQILAFAQQSGSILIDPLEIEVNVVLSRRNRNTFEDFFFGSNYQNIPHRLNSNSIRLNVKEFTSKPEDFCGGVGSFSLSATIDAQKVETNEPITVKYTLSGKGNFPLINELPANFPLNIDAYDPKISEDLTHSKKGLSGSKTFEYVLIPRADGRHEIPELSFSYYDLTSKKFKTLSSPAFNVEVSKGKGENRTLQSENLSVVNEREKYRSRDIEYISLARGGLKSTVFFLHSPLFWCVIVGITLLYIVLLIFLHLQDKQRKDIVGSKLRQSKHMAKKRLLHAKDALKKGEKELFFTSISQAIWNYLSDRLMLPLSELSMDEIETTLHKNNVPLEQIGKVLEVLNQCEYARFSPDSGISFMDDLYQEALLVITQLESYLKS